MANLIVRNLDEQLVQSLKKRAAEHGRSAEAEHRAILEAALTKTRRRTLAQVLAAMPDVGKDADFERSQDKGATRVFD
jgi:plasmid stability protein